jgi:uncharacterized protein DUF5335
MLQRLDPRHWRSFFQVISARLLGKRAAIEIASLDVGAQIVAESLPVLGIRYDPHEDCVEIVLDGFEHQVRQPRAIYFEQTPLGPETFGLVDVDGALQIVRLREPLMLPG